MGDDMPLELKMFFFFNKWTTSFAVVCNNNSFHKMPGFCAALEPPKNTQSLIMLLAND